METRSPRALVDQMRAAGVTLWTDDETLLELYEERAAIMAGNKRFTGPPEPRPMRMGLGAGEGHFLVDVQRISYTILIA